MATFYSDHFGPLVGATNHFTTQNSVQPAVNVGFKHSRVRRTSCLFSVPNAQDLGSGDIIRLFDMSSNDRLINLYFSMNASWGATTTFDVGVYEKGSDNDGAVVDINLFATADIWSANILREDLFKEAGTVDDWDRGKALWELVNIGLGATTYGTSTNAQWTIACTTTQDISATDAIVEFMVEAFYVAGD